MFVAAYESVFTDELQSVRRLPKSEDDYVFNANLVLEELRNRLPTGVTIPVTITGERLCSGEVAAIRFLVSVFLELNRMVAEYTRSNVGTQQGPRSAPQPAARADTGAGRRAGTRGSGPGRSRGRVRGRSSTSAGHGEAHGGSAEAGGELAAGERGVAGGGGADAGGGGGGRGSGPRRRAGGADGVVPNASSGEDGAGSGPGARVSGRTGVAGLRAGGGVAVPDAGELAGPSATPHPGARSPPLQVQGGAHGVPQGVAGRVGVGAQASTRTGVRPVSRSSGLTSSEGGYVYCG